MSHPNMLPTRGRPAGNGSYDGIRSADRWTRLLVAHGMALGIIALSTGCAAGRTRPGDFQAHINILAADALEGRGIGTPGIELAAGYIAGQFASLGIEPGGVDQTYFQPFEMSTGSELSEDYEFALTGVTATPVRKQDYLPFSFSNNDPFDGDVVFAGYGLVNEEQKHDDYQGLNVQGKVVLILRHEPPVWGKGQGWTRHASFQNKVYTAKEKGAAAVLVVSRLSEDGRDELMRFGGPGGGGGGYGLPALHLKQSLADQLLTAGKLDSLKTLQERLDAGEGDAFASAALPGVRLKGRAGVTVKTTLVRNVLGVIRGEGPLADEYVVIGGHFDHLGNTAPMMGFRRSETPPEAEIHNGADDNASGTAGVIEAGRLLMQRRPLKRSVLLMAFTGEETGLNGSAHFVEHPTVPLDKIVAMLNMDMVGRLHPEKNTIEIFGTQAADEFEEMIARLTKNAGLELRANASALGPSDHTSFYKKKIPSLHYFTGLHDDYHKPGDDSPKINAEGGAKVIDLVVATADEIIRRDPRPTYHEVTERAQIDRTGGGPRVRIGIMPGYADEGKQPGMVVDGVAPDGPAAAAGIKGGDRIVRLGSATVNNIEDYMAALRNNKPGDVVEVVVVREGTELPIKVTLAGR